MFGKDFDCSIAAGLDKENIDELTKSATAIIDLLIDSMFISMRLLYLN
jgi:hypothetical protein